jgi:hypothetical protein
MHLHPCVQQALRERNSHFKSSRAFARIRVFETISNGPISRTLVGDLLADSAARCYLSSISHRRARTGLERSVGHHHQHFHLCSFMLNSPCTCSNDLKNRIPHHFINNLIGSVDTFPIICHRPVENQSHLYNGKYKAHVYKVRAPVCPHTR